MKNRVFALVLLLLAVTASEAFAETPPKRVISLAPNITEMMFKIGAGHLLVGRTDYCLYPEAAESVDGVGGYLNPDFEKIVTLEPDIIFLLPNSELERKINRLDLKTFTLPNETVEDIVLSIGALGRVLGHSDQAGRVVQGIQDTLDWVRNNSQGRYPVSSLLVVGREAGSLKSIYAAGKETYLSELLSLCGGQNIYSDVDSRYFDVSKEDLIFRNPDAILEFRISNGEDMEAEIASLKSDWSVLSTVSAVEFDHIHVLTDRYFLIPGPRIAQAAMTIFDIFQQASE